MALYILSVPFTTEIYPQTRHGGGGGGVCAMIVATGASGRSGGRLD